MKRVSIKSTSPNQSKKKKKKKKAENEKKKRKRIATLENLSKNRVAEKDALYGGTLEGKT